MEKIESILTDCILNIKSGKITLAECLDRYDSRRNELEPLLKIALNIHELPDLITLAHQFKAEFVIVSHLLPHTDAMKQEILYESSSEESRKLFLEAEAEARKNGVDLEAEVKSKFLFI